MAKLELTDTTLQNLDRRYLRNVLQNMRNAAATVRFGTTGKGISPHYQVKYSNQVVRAINGISHENFDPMDSFDDSNLSDPFGYEVIETAFEKSSYL